MEILNYLSIEPLNIHILEAYVNVVMEWNQRTNLTGASTSAHFIRGPLFDALTLLPVLEKSGTLVDIGSGGGLPGIPAKILVPQIEITLVEPRIKRVTFLRHVISHLELEAEVIQGRDVSFGGRLWSGAVAEAVWPPKKWLARGNKLIGPHGAIYTLSSTSLSPTDIPKDTVIEEQQQFTRPWDGAEKFAARVVREK
jgi:16S rRNA (guanine527-N7)-methyltransferase